MDTNNGQANIQGINKLEQIEREHNRWLMVLYDTALYALCWLILFLSSPIGETIPKVNLAIYVVTGYLLFFGFRFALRCYKRIWRYGSIHAFSREIAASLSATLVLTLLDAAYNHFFATLIMPYAYLILSSTIYIVVSIAFRIFYCYLYRFAETETKIARTARRLLEKFAFVDFQSKKPGALLRLVLEPDQYASGPINELQNIIDQFAIRGTVTNITQINKGYINRTYRVETISDRGHVHKYTLQRINTNVFPNVDDLMDNFKLTTDHLHGRLSLPGGRKIGAVPTIRPTKEGCSYLRDASGCWRMLTYFDDVFSLDIPSSPEIFYQAGRAFGGFMKEMADIDAAEVKEVIPNFHNTQSRYRDLEASILKDPKGRVKDVQKEIAFVRARADKYSLISEALESGKIPTRICHNDCNMNNILFDNKSHLPVAIIDLDTVMPSSPLYDYGDSMRIGTNTATDDEKDLSKVSCDLEMYERYARGYLEACGDILTKEELELLPYASLIITSEDGIRFLMDHIDGDTYYNIYYPGQNLDRSRTQLTLVEDMERKLPQIKEILQNIYKDLKLDVTIQ